MDKKNIYPIALIIAGLALIGLGFAEIVDEFWSGMGSALLVVGILQVLRFYRLRTNDAYREKVEIEASDERNRFIRSKAWAWAGYLFILIAAVTSIVLRILGQELLSLAASCAVCLMLLLFWVCYQILRKKY